MKKIVYFYAVLFSSIVIFSQTRSKVIFKQTRIGKDAKRFELIKFLTMKESKSGNQMIMLGKFLRKTFIDELPQIEIAFSIVKDGVSFLI